MGLFSYVTMAVVLALILPSLAVSVRRLHDIDRTGWWVLIGATFIGTLVLIYWACLPGTSGSNRFGKIGRRCSAGCARRGETGMASACDTVARFCARCDLCRM